MTKLTKERLQQLADVNTICKVSWDERIAMARQLLAGLEQEQEPVAWVRYCSDGTIDGPLLNYQIDDCRKPSWSPLYAAPQLPQPVEPEITSEELDDELLEQLIDFRRDTLNYHKKEGNRVQTVMHGVVLRAMLELQERRAAMLQGAEPVSQPCTLPDGWVAVPSEPTQEMLNAWLSEIANWRGHVAGYKAMLAAAPQQETDNG